MTFLEKLQSHKGGLLRIKSELFWYDGRGWDRTPDRVCLILDAGFDTLDLAARVLRVDTAAARVAALLLIDGAPRWVWVAHADVEIL